MKTRTSILTWVGAAMYLLWALFHIAIGAYHTYLFTAQGSQSLFSTAYGIAASATDMQDPARQLGSDAIEVYSLLLAGFGVLTIWGTISVLRGQRWGLWLNTIFPGFAVLAYLYGLVLPGQLAVANAAAGPLLYLLGLICMWLGRASALAEGPALADARSR